MAGVAQVKRGYVPDRSEAGHADRCQAPVQWVLTTTLPFEMFEQPTMGVRVYRLRWTIEELLRATKQGSNYESHQLESAPGRLVAPALFLLAAWYLPIATGRIPKLILVRTGILGHCQIARRLKVTGNTSKASPARG